MSCFTLLPFEKLPSVAFPPPFGRPARAGGFKKGRNVSTLFPGKKGRLEIGK
jgi:hypothetical protein